MDSRQRKRRPRADLVLAMAALFAAITGSAAALPGKNTVRSDDIAPRAVKTKDIAVRAVGPSELLGKPLPPARAARALSARQSGLEQSKTISSPEAGLSLFNDDDLLVSGLLADNGISEAADDSVSFEELTQASVAPSDLGVFPTAQVGSNVDIPIPFGTLTTVPFNTVAWNLGGMVSSDGNRLCASVSGAYSLYAQLLWEQNPHGSREVFIVRDDGKALAHSVVNAVAGRATWQFVSTDQVLKAGECARTAVIQAALDPVLGPQEVDLGSAGSYVPSFAAMYTGPA